MTNYEPIFVSGDTIKVYQYTSMLNRLISRLEDFAYGISGDSAANLELIEIARDFHRSYHPMCQLLTYDRTLETKV